MTVQTQLSQHFEKLASLARFIDESVSAEEAYEHLTRGVCQNSQWDISSIQVLDLEEGSTTSIYRHDPFNAGAETQTPNWDASKSPVGIALEEGIPVVLNDAAKQDDYPGFRDDAIARGYHTTVIIPLDLQDANHRPLVYSVASRVPIELEEGDVEFLQCVAALSAIAIRKARKLEEERREAERMRAILERMTSSLTTNLDRQAAGSLASDLSTLFPAGWLAVDLTTGRGLFDPDATPPIPLNSAQRLPAELITAAVNSSDLPPEKRTTFSYEGKLVTAEVSALVIDSTHVGALFFFGDETLSHHERIAAQAGRLALTSFILRGFVEFKARHVSAKRLVQKLVLGDWNDWQDIRNEADRLDFDLSIPIRIVMAVLPGDEPISDSTHSFVLRSAQAIFGATISCLLDGKLILLISDGLKDDFAAMQKRFLVRIKPFTPSGILLVASDLNKSVKQLPRARETCDSTLLFARSIGAKGWVTPTNIGAFSSLMASADLGRVGSFLAETLTGVLGRDDKKGQVAIETLETYLRKGRRYQETADILGIHVSTLRYRLDQLADQLGIDFNDSDKCFELEFALRLRAMHNSYEQ